MVVYTLEDDKGLVVDIFSTPAKAQERLETMFARTAEIDWVDNSEDDDEVVFFGFVAKFMYTIRQCTVV